MYCQNCGASNDDDARFCKSCGVALCSASVRSASTTLQDPRRDAVNQSAERLSFVEALHHTLKAAGFEVLNNPRKLLAYTADLCDTDSSEFRVLEHNCTTEVLAPFAVLTPEDCNEGEINDAANQSYLALCDRSIDSIAAECVAKSLRNAVARYLYLPEVEVPSIGVMPGGTVYDAGSAHTGSSATVVASQGQSDNSWSQSNGSWNSAAARQEVDRMGPSSADTNWMGSTSQGAYATPPQQMPQPVSPYAPAVQPPHKSTVSPGLIALLVALVITVGALTYILVSRANKSVSASPSAASTTETSDTGEVDSSDDQDTDTSQTEDNEEAEEVEPEPEPEPTPAESFPRRWSGTYIGTSSLANTSDHHISRAVAFDFTSVSESGHLEGVCYVGADYQGPGETWGTCYVSGTVNWDTGSITMEGTGWIDQGGLGDLRSYSGTVNFSARTMSGTAWDLRTGDYETPWNISAVDQISILQNGNLVTVP